MKLDNGMTYIRASTTLSREMIASILNRIETKLFPLTEERVVHVSRENSH